MFRNVVVAVAMGASIALPVSVLAADDARSTAANAFNPAISLIVSGQYSHQQLDPQDYRIGGFIPGGDEVGPGVRGFSIGESELTLSANIDPYLSGYFVLSVSGENAVSVEEGVIQNAGLAPGVNLKFGRMLSAFGYLNEQHSHAWDFSDAPLVHQVFFGGKLQEDGLQARWLAPTPLFVELGAETGRGANFPGTERNTNSLNSTMAFLHVGDDIGVSSSYRIGASYRRTQALNRPYEDMNSMGAAVVNAFTGDSTIWGLDLVWKWSPNGNAVDRNLKLVAEYMHRTEDGTLSFNTTGTESAGAYRSSQAGWYVQAAYQFMPRWRVGLRQDRLDSGRPVLGLNLVRPGGPTVADFPGLAPYRPQRLTAMIDFSPSEFSRFRVQVARDEARRGVSDNQWNLQYLMSLGAHGAHKF